MKIANLSDSSVRRYGEIFEPKSDKTISDDVVETYSIAEISAATQSIAKSLNSIVFLLEKKNERDLISFQSPILVRILEPFRPKRLSLYKRIQRRLRKAKP